MRALLRPVRRRLDKGRARLKRHLLRRYALTEIVKQTGNFADTTWLGKPIWQNIADIWTIQETIVLGEVDLIVECGTNRGGSAFFYASLFDNLGKGHVITIDVEQLSDIVHPRIEYIHGSSTAPEVLDTVRRRISELAPRRILVVLDSDHAAGHVLDELRLYADIVPVGDYMHVQDGVIDELPIFSDTRPGPLKAIETFLSEDSRFTEDERLSNRFILNHSPRGWLKRVH